MKSSYPSWLIKCASVFVLAMVTVPLDVGRAASVEEFYQSRNLTVYIGSAAGAGYDLYGRTVARHIGKHLPGTPSVVAENMPGAGSIILANFMYNKAPRDGSAIAIIQNATALEPLLGNKNARYKASEMNWLGSVNQQTNVCISWAASGIRSIPDVQNRDVLTGVVSSTATESVANLMNDLVGAKLKLIKGYPSTSGVLLAMQRGEVEALCGIGIDSVQSSMGTYLESKQINVFAQIGPQPHPELGGVSFVYDFLKDPSDKELLDFLVARMLMGRPFVAPPDLPAERVKVLRDAFWATVNDPEFLAEAKKINMPVLPNSGDEVQQLVQKLDNAPKELIARAVKVIGPTGGGN